MGAKACLELWKLQGDECKHRQSCRFLDPQYEPDQTTRMIPHCGALSSAWQEVRIFHTPASVPWDLGQPSFEKHTNLCHQQNFGFFLRYGSFTMEDSPCFTCKTIVVFSERGSAANLGPGHQSDTLNVTVCYGKSRKIVMFLVWKHIELYDLYGPWLPYR